MEIVNLNMAPFWKFHRCAIKNVVAHCHSKHNIVVIIKIILNKYFLSLIHRLLTVSAVPKWSNLPELNISVLRCVTTSELNRLISTI